MPIAPWVAAACMLLASSPARPVSSIPGAAEQSPPAASAVQAGLNYYLSPNVRIMAHG